MWRGITDIKHDHVVLRLVHQEVVIYQLELGVENSVVKYQVKGSRGRYFGRSWLHEAFAKPWSRVDQFE
jgi:hypothetical protein